MENWKYYNHEDYDPTHLTRLKDKYNIDYGHYDQDKYVNHNDLSELNINTSFMVELGNDQVSHSAPV